MMERVYKIDDPFVSRLAALLFIPGLATWLIGAFRGMTFTHFLGIVLTLGGAALAVIMRAKIIIRDEGIEYCKAFGETKLIPYDEVDWVKIDTEYMSSGGGRSGSSGRTLIYKMTIITRQGNIVLRERGGQLLSMAAFNDVYARDRMILSSSFCQIESFIREKKGMDPKPAALSSFLREKEAKRASLGKL